VALVGVLYLPVRHDCHHDACRGGAAFFTCGRERSSRRRRPWWEGGSPRRCRMPACGWGRGARGHRCSTGLGAGGAVPQRRAWRPDVWPVGPRPGWP